MKYFLLIGFCISTLSIATPEDPLAKLYSKIDDIFSNGQKITPSPEDIFPNGVTAENGKCVQFEHNAGHGAVGNVFNYNTYSSVYPHTGHLISVKSDPLEGRLFYFGDFEIRASFEKGDYYWESSHPINNVGDDVRYSLLRRVRVTNPVSSINEFWVSFFQSKWTDRDYYRDIYCYYW